MQDNKNLILAIVLCLIILFGWGHVAEYMGWVAKPDPAQVAEKQEAARKEAEKAEARKAEAERTATLPTFTPSAGRDVSVDSPLYKAVLYSGGGPLRSYELKKYQAGLAPDSPLVNLVDERTAAVAPLGLVINGQPSWSTGQWALEGADALTLGEGQQATVRLTGMVDNLRVVRELTFSADTYLIKEKIRLINTGSQARSVRVGATAALDSSIATGSQYDSMRVAWDENGSVDEESSAKTLGTTGVQATGKIWWAGPMSTYFLAAVLPGDPDSVTVKGVAQNTVFRAAVEEPEHLIEPGEERELSYSYWFGPKVRSELEAVGDQLARSIQLGFFSIIAKGLLWLLEFFHGFVHNWGVAIIFLTLFIKAVFWPLTAKSYASMEKMKQLQPMMLAIREKYKGNREEMNKEVMALYKTYGVNPASGCVPILIQLPVFFGLYQALLTSIALRHASFITYLPGTDIIWLADLSAKDPLYITPIIMGITMFLQQRMSPPPADPMQQKIMLFLPLIFTVLFLNFPSGLVLYWLVNNILSIFQQWLMMRKLKHGGKTPQKAPAAK